MNRLLPAIVFDFGGVLIDWNPRHLYRKLFDDSAAMESFLTEIGFMEWNVRQDEGRPFAAATAELCKQFPQYTELIKAYDERWEETISGPIAATVDILYALKQAGYPLYGLTNWSTEKFYIVRPQYQFFDCFEDIVVSGDVKLIKPDPRIFHLMLDRIGRPAEACLFIDDSLPNVEAAARLGFNAIRFSSAEALAASLEALKILPQNAAN